MITTTLPICRVCGQQKSVQQTGRVVCLPCNREKSARKRRKYTCLPCATCGLAKTPRTDGFMICRPCVRASAIRASSLGVAANAALRAAAQTPADPREPTAFDMFDAMCEVNCIGRTVPRMNPNAGRLRAGESLYPRREVAV